MLHTDEVLKHQPQVRMEQLADEKDKLRFRWEALPYWGEFAPEKVLTRYRFDNQNWSDWSLLRQAELKSPTPGPHSIDVEAKLLQLTSRPPVQSLQFESIPPFYQRPMFWIPFLFLSGMVIYLAVTLILKRVQYTRDLEGAKEKAEAASKAKGEFLAVISHELRTPMNGILGMTTILMDSRLDPEQKDCAETIRSSADALLVLLNDVLDYSKIEAGKLEFNLQPYSVRQTMEDAIIL